MPWPLYLALKQLFPSGKRVSFFFFLSVCGVMLGVMLLVIVQSVMGGFGQIYRQKIVETNGHIRIESGGVVYNQREIIEKLDLKSEIAAVSAYARGVVMLQNRGRPAFPFIHGIDTGRKEQVVSIEQYMILGSFDELDDDSVLVSSSLARSIGINLGSTVEVYTPLMLEKLKNDEIFLPRELNVAGIFETGWNDFDSNMLVTTLGLVQELYNLGDGVHGIGIRLKDGIDENRFSADLNEELIPPLRALTWIDMFRDFLWVLKLEKNMMFFLLIFVVLVSAFVIAIAQLLTVVRKTREIGLLGAIGARPIQLVACYCFQGLFIGVLGTALGILTGLSALYFRNDIVHGFAVMTKSEDALLRFYQFANLPVDYALNDFVLISVAAMVLSTLAGLVPAWMAARMNPAEALRNE